MIAPAESPRARFLAMFALVVAGEMIFSLPFHLPRYFRPSVLEGFALTNAGLGDVFAVYGVTAMAAYFPGGALADRYPARRLMCASLLATAGGGLYLATLPGRLGLALLYGYWGVTTILLFWAAMIRATRRWGGAQAQGRAFGWLDGGRGLAAAVFATIAVWCFTRYVGFGSVDVDGAGRRAGLAAVILFYTAATAGAAVLVWRCVPAATDAGGARAVRAAFCRVLGLPVVWLQAGIVVCAYCGYKGLDNYALYAVDVLGLGESEAASFSAGAAYLRPLAAILAGTTADRLGATRSIAALFVALTLLYSLLAFMTAPHPLTGVIYASLLLTFAAVFALRGIYFAVLAESRVPFAHTGTAVGLVSLVGYTPDIFFAPVAGRVLDASPGAPGHAHYFIMLAAVAIIGWVLALWLRGRQRLDVAATGDAINATGR